MAGDQYMGQMMSLEGCCPSPQKKVASPWYSPPTPGPTASLCARSFVLHRPLVWIPLPQGAGAGGEVGTPAALVAQRPHDDAWVVLRLGAIG